LAIGGSFAEAATAATLKSYTTAKALETAVKGGFLAGMKDADLLSPLILQSGEVDLEVRGGEAKLLSSKAPTSRWL